MLDPDRGTDLIRRHTSSKLLSRRELLVRAGAQKASPQKFFLFLLLLPFLRLCCPRAGISFLALSSREALR